MGRVLPVKKFTKSILERKIEEAPKESEVTECPVCGKGMKIYCVFCYSYHYPETCTGEGCKLCNEIKIFLEDKKKYVDKKVDL